MPNTEMIANKETQRDYGTDCRQCQRYKTLGDVCVVEHGKKFLWEFCKDFEPEIVLPDYKELMRSVRTDMATERRKEKEKKQRERRKKQKEREAAQEERRKNRRVRLARKRRLEKKREERRKERSKSKAAEES
jgi:hypothetical protein